MSLSLSSHVVHRLYLSAFEVGVGSVDSIKTSANAIIVMFSCKLFILYGDDINEVISLSVSIT